MAEKKKKAAKKKVTKQVGTKRCGVKGCRKAIVVGTEVCRVHQGEDPLEAAKQLSELDLLKFLQSDTELRNHDLEMKNLQQAQVLENQEHARRKNERQARLSELVDSAEVRKIEQRNLMVRFGKKYGFDPALVSIDDKTGTIHEHRPGPEK